MYTTGAALLRPDRLSMFLAVAVVSLNNLLIHTPKLADASAKLVPWLFVSTVISSSSSSGSSTSSRSSMVPWPFVSTVSSKLYAVSGSGKLEAWSVEVASGDSSGTGASTSQSPPSHW